MSMFQAIDSSDAEEVKRLLKTDPTLLEGVHTRNGYRRPLIYAAGGGRMEMVKVLVESGADIHATSRDGGTALHYAAGQGDEGVVAYLLDNGASSLQLDQSGTTPLMWAAMNGRTRAALLLLEHMAEQGLEARERFDGRTALHCAVSRGFEEVVTQLLYHGARADTTDRHGASAVKIAVENGHVEIVRLLVDHLGPQALQERDGKGQSLLHIASQKALEQMADYLLRNGLMPTMRDQDGSTPLMYGAGSGSAKVIGKVLEYMTGEELDQRNQYGRTALHWAVANDRPENVRCLLMAGANPKIVDNHGRTPRALAEQKHHSTSVAVFSWCDVEVERRSVLYRARALHDAYTIHQEAPTRPVPGYLKARVEAGLDLPKVEVLIGQQYGAGWEGDRKRPRSATKAYAARMQNESDLPAMLGFVVEGLSEELFTELLQGFYAPG